MSQRWLKFLEFLGSPLRAKAAPVDVFAPGRVREGAWYEFAHHEALFRLFGPHPDSPWYPYHCPTIFAAIDKLHIMPRPIATSAEITAEAPAGAWKWLTSESAVIVELAGGLSVQLGARLLVEAGAQLVSTFDHWPRANPMPKVHQDPRGLAAQPWPPQAVSRSVAIDSRDVIDCMASLAPNVFARIQQGIAADAPPVWMCDMRRMAVSKPGPGNFDNRYFIDDSILPSAKLLSRKGIRWLVYFSYLPAPSPSADLVGFLRDCHEAGIHLYNAAVTEPTTWVEPLPITTPPPEARFLGFQYPKSRAGGFGRRVPVPTESSGSGAFAGAGG